MIMMKMMMMRRTSNVSCNNPAGAQVRDLSTKSSTQLPSSSCWYILIYTDIYWYILIYTDIYWFTLMYIDTSIYHIDLCIQNTRYLYIMISIYDLSTKSSTPLPWWSCWKMLYSFKYIFWYQKILISVYLYLHTPSLPPRCHDDHGERCYISRFIWYTDIFLYTLYIDVYWFINISYRSIYTKY